MQKSNEFDNILYVCIYNYSKHNPLWQDFNTVAVNLRNHASRSRSEWWLIFYGGEWSENFIYTPKQRVSVSECDILNNKYLM